MAAAANASRRQTGGGQSGLKPMTEIEKKFLDILGSDFAEGLPGMRVEPFEEVSFVLWLPITPIFTVIIFLLNAMHCNKCEICFVGTSN
jgi:hypothetical protein